VLLVAFGAPRQDRFIADLIQSADIPIAMGVGGTFDVIAGAIPRAPAWMQRAGLEWLWRMAQEPDRLWRRYLLRDLPFLLRMTIRALAARPEAA
jgi:N-acetylglucosaminyldiphosphoundecaprenol N-acetyl-beta-D-mannosaminyltransferase